MPILIPIPDADRIDPPKSEEVKDIKESLESLIKDWNKIRPILRQDINRLNTPDQKITDYAQEIEDIGYVLAILVQRVGGNQPTNLAFPPAPVVNQNRINTFLRRFAFMQ